MEQGSSGAGKAVSKTGETKIQHVNGMKSRERVQNLLEKKFTYDTIGIIYTTNVASWERKCHKYVT